MTDWPKRAGEVAVRIVQSAGNDLDATVDLIAKALLAFKAEAVTELFEGEDCKVARLEQEAFQKGREAAIEECAKVADDLLDTAFWHCTNGRIRALKRPQGEL